MVVPLDKPHVISNRYQMLSPQPIAKEMDNQNDNVEDGLRYVSFIKLLPNGKSKEHKHVIRSPTPPPTKFFTKGSKKGGSQHTSPVKKVNNPMQAVTKVKTRNEELHNKKMKEIEDCMFQTKQYERELKRIEGDILQRGKKLKKTMKDYENEVYKNIMKEQGRMQTAGKEEVNVKQQSFIEDAKLTKDRMQRNTNITHKEKEVDMKAANNISNIEFRCENVAEAIKLKKLQVTNLVKEFETKVREKEEEEFKLKQEFANLTVELNMEAQKRRVESSKNELFTKKTDEKDKSEQLNREELLTGKIKYHKDKATKGESAMRRLSLEKQNVFDTLNRDEREDGRRLKDVKVKIQGNAQLRKHVQFRADRLEMGRLGTKSTEKILTVTANRKIIQDMLSAERKQKNDLSKDQWRQRSFMVNHATKKVGLEDNISHFQKTVTKQENTEHSLFSRVKKVEYERRKQEQTVDLMKQELIKLQSKHKNMLLEAAKIYKLKENDVEDRLRKEEAQLSKVLSEREERIQTLNRCRGLLSEDKHMLDEETKVRDRLIRIQEKSNILRLEETSNV